MQIFNIGPVEFLLILLIMFILLGPEGMVKTARQIGSWIRQAVRSPIWRDIMGYSQEIRELPTKIVRETGLDEDLAEIRKTAQETSHEINQSMQEANEEVKKSLEETGSVQVSIDVNQIKPPTAPESESPPAPASTNVDYMPLAQTSDKYATNNDGEEDDES
jgi:sec-independent protein translocase protein TatB